MPRAARQAAASRQTIPCNGGFTFAEDPDLAAPEARIIWHADFDPGTLRVRAVPAAPGDPDGFDPVWIERWLTIVDDADGGQHAVVSDGLRHIRLDLDDGLLVAGQPVILHYQLYGVESAEKRILPLRQLLRLIRDRRFPARLFPPLARDERAILLLRVRDALEDRASQREIARVLFGLDDRDSDSLDLSDSIRSRVRRLVRDVRRLTQGDYRTLMTHEAKRRSRR